MKYCDDSAAHAIMTAETIIAGAVHSAVAGWTWGMGTANNRSRKKAGWTFRRGNRPMVQRTYAQLSRGNAAARLRSRGGARRSGSRGAVSSFRLGQGVRGHHQGRVEAPWRGGIARAGWPLVRG